MNVMFKVVPVSSGYSVVVSKDNRTVEYTTVTIKETASLVNELLVVHDVDPDMNCLFRKEVVS